MPATSIAELATRLGRALALSQPPVAIRFLADPPADVEPFSEPMPQATADGRTGRVAAGCVFWVRASERTFSTRPEDHANCSVGSYTHGLKSLEEAAQGADIAAIVEAGWVSPEAFPSIPAVRERPAAISYGPLGQEPSEPDVVLVRINAKQAMVLSDALPDLRFEGKPQCHIIPMAKEQGTVAISVGCMLSRVRTGMANHEMTCAFPGGRLGEVVEAIERTREIDDTVAAYAADDAKRFRPAAAGQVQDLP